MHPRFAAPSTRRALAPIRGALADLAEGDVVAAEFYTRVYGAFTIRGPVRRSHIDKQWGLGGWLLSLVGRDQPAPELRSLTAVEVVDTAEDAEDQQIAECLEPLEQGSVVRATFDDATFGRFTIEGAVRHTLSKNQWVVGAWLLTATTTASPSSRLRALEVLESAPPGLELPAVSVSALGQGAVPADESSEDFTPPTWRGSVEAKWNGICRLCGQAWAPGDRIWVMRGNKWFCTPCRWPEARATPTLDSVRTKIAHRCAQGLPTNLDLRELAILTDLIGVRGDLEPVRYGSERTWSARADNADWNGDLTTYQERIRSLAEAYGIALDALEHRFNPNLPNHWARALEEYAVGAATAADVSS